MLLKSVLALALVTGIYGKSDFAARSLLSSGDQTCPVGGQTIPDDKEARKAAENAKTALLSELEGGYAGLSNRRKDDVRGYWEGYQSSCTSAVYVMVNWFSDVMTVMNSQDTKTAVDLCSVIIDESQHSKKDKEDMKKQFEVKLKSDVWDQLFSKQYKSILPGDDQEKKNDFEAEGMSLIWEIITESLYPVIKDMTVDKFMDTFKKKVDSGKVTKEQKKTLIDLIDLTDKEFEGATFDDMINGMIGKFNDNNKDGPFRISDELKKTIKDDVKRYKKKVRATANGDWSTGAIVAVIVIPIVAVAVIAGGVIFYMKKK